MFLIETAPAGAIEVWCGGLWRNYSDGVRLLTLGPSQRIDVDVPVVALSEEPGTTMGGIGAELDDAILIPQLADVQSGGPASAAGFQNGDVIITVDGASVTELSPDGVWRLLISRPPGTKVKVGATRAGKVVNGEITLGAAPL
jgi:S1-C subfamily serine protease